MRVPKCFLFYHYFFSFVRSLRVQIMTHKGKSVRPPHLAARQWEILGYEHRACCGDGTDHRQAVRRCAGNLGIPGGGGGALTPVTLQARLRCSFVHFYQFSVPAFSVKALNHVDRAKCVTEGVKTIKNSHGALTDECRAPTSHRWVRVSELGTSAQAQ